MSKIKHLEHKGRPGRKIQPPRVRNAGIEQAVSEAGGIRDLSRLINVRERQISEARRLGPTPRIILIVWERAKVKLSKLLGRSVTCENCGKEI